MTPTLADLQSSSLVQLESLYVEERAVSMPVPGIYDGYSIIRLHNRGADFPPNLYLQKLMFEAVPFGVNIFGDHGDWFFFGKNRLAMGRFVPRIGRSRWRDTTTVTLNYESSRLPRPIRRVLYDEVKPLSDTLLLGFGGINFDKGIGDNFFFALEKR